MVMRTLLSAWLLAAALAAMFGPSPAPAAVTAGQVAPAQANVALNRAARIAVRWTLTTDAGPFVRSTRAVLEDAAGNVYLTVPGTLSAPAPNAGPQPPAGTPASETVRIPETLAIPASALARAFNAGVSRLFYRRDFEDGTGLGRPVSLTLHLTGAGAAGFSVNYVGLRFDDQTVRRLVSPAARLRAQATIRFTGSGQLRAVWEVADPASASGTPVFRPLRVVRRPLFGGQAAIIESPPLPTDRSGLHLVRLRLIEPAVPEEPVVLQYYVSAEGGRGLAPIEVLAPASDTLLSAGTQFRWRPLAGVAAYRLEFHPEGEAATVARAVAGMEVDGARSTLALSPLVVRHLRPGAGYRWRLVAIGEDGARIGASDWRGARVGGE